MPGRRPPLAPQTLSPAATGAPGGPGTVRPSARVRPPTAFPSGPAGPSPLNLIKGPPLKAFDSGGSTSDDDAAKAKKKYDSNIFRRTFGTSKDWFGGSSGAPAGAAPPAPGGGPAAVSTSNGGWNETAGPPTPAPAGWKGLSDQSRDAAFDPNYDSADPNNKHVVDIAGRVNPQVYAQLMQGREGQGTSQTAYSPPPKPATQLTSAKALNDKINQMIGAPPEPPPPPTNADFDGSGQWPRVPLQAQPNPQVAGPLPDPMGRNVGVQQPPSLRMPTSPRVAQQPRPPAVDLSQGVNVPRFGGTRDNPDPSTPVSASRGSPVQAGFLPRATDWLHRLGQTGQLYAGGGRVGLAMGGMPDIGDPNDDYRTAVAQPIDEMIGIPKVNVGGSHAVTGQSAMPQAPAPPSAAGGKGGGGGGGMGDIMGMAMKVLPFLLARGGRAGYADGGPLDDMSGVTVNPYPYGGRTGFMRGGYPEAFNQPPMPIPGLPQRTAFSGRGYVEGDGQGNGRSDHIDAALSPGEYVMDAETTSLLGDGDNEAGARKFEQMRQNIRKHKGKQLAAGKFSPAAKPPEAYLSPKLSAADRLAHSGVSDGMRRGRR